MVYQSELLEEIKHLLELAVLQCHRREDTWCSTLRPPWSSPISEVNFFFSFIPTLIFLFHVPFMYNVCRVFWRPFAALPTSLRL